MSNFVIKNITVFDNCNPKILKNLLPTTYKFTEYKYPRFYGSNITVQAIVGENGSGKSSLLELMFRMINNFAAVFFRNYRRNSSNPLYFILGIFAKLEFKVNDIDGCLICKNDIILFEYGKKIKVQYSVKNRIESDIYVNIRNLDEKSLYNIANLFFYTIVSNYSMQSYLPDDYMDEMILSYSKCEKTGEEKWKPIYGKCWIDSLFGNNDGYLCPISLNPFRENGIIDMSRESQFATERVSSILIEYYRMNKQYLKGYDLKQIEYRFYPQYITGKFESLYINESDSHKYKRLLHLFKNVCCSEHTNSVANIILQTFCIPQTKDSTILWTCRLLIVIEVLEIAQKYSPYSKFITLGNINNAFVQDLDSKKIKEYKSLAKSVRYDSSHISVSVRQTYNMMKHLYLVNDPTVFLRRFNYSNFARYLNLKMSSSSVSDRVQFLPPPCFVPKIILTRKDAYGNKNLTPFNKLSSGEKQFIYTTSSVIYHMLNLRSIKKGRPTYRLFNIVLDEVEICFHPEYQRTFIENFLRIIKNLGFMDRCGINVIMTTHSPFILSDIIQSNILYLENGKPIMGKEKRNPFGANVNDILHQSFFLKNGFMGSLSQRMYSRLVNFLSGDEERNEYNMEHAVWQIDILGDPILKMHLKRLYNAYVKRKHLDVKIYGDNSELPVEILRELLNKLEQNR